MKDNIRILMNALLQEGRTIFNKQWNLDLEYVEDEDGSGDICYKVEQLNGEMMYFRTNMTFHGFVKWAKEMTDGEAMILGANVALTNMNRRNADKRSS